MADIPRSLRRRVAAAAGHRCGYCLTSQRMSGAQMHVEHKSGTQVPLFNPRTQVWAEHFGWSDDFIEIVGLTPIGRATVHALHLNNEFILPARRQWRQAGWHPAHEDTIEA